MIWFRAVQIETDAAERSVAMSYPDAGDVDVKRVLSVSFVAVVAFLMLAAPAFAQGGGGNSGIHFSNAFGAAVTIIGAAWGIGRIGQAAVESMARQPEVAGNIQTAMIIAGALIEGVTLFALVVCMLSNGSYHPFS